MNIELQNIGLRFDSLQVLQELSMDFREKEITVVLGPSGCGKTTVLNLLTSMIEADSGVIRGIDKKRFSYLFQEPRLLPWLTVKGNLLFVLDEISVKSEREAICTRVLEMTGLEEYSQLYPSQLSGGMRQRVAIARAFAHPSDIILMDEPFQGLDIKRKTSLLNQFIKLWEEEKPTTIMVTHDMAEAIRLADSIYVLSEKPASVEDHFAIEIPRTRRIPGTEQYSSIESRLYKLLS